MPRPGQTAPCPRPAPAAARRTMQNYLVWRLVLDRISSLSRRFRDARASYRKVQAAPHGAGALGSGPRGRRRAASSRRWAPAPGSALLEPTSVAWGRDSPSRGRP